MRDQGPRPYGPARACPPSTRPHTGGHRHAFRPSPPIPSDPHGERSLSFLEHGRPSFDHPYCISVPRAQRSRRGIGGIQRGGCERSGRDEPECHKWSDLSHAQSSRKPRQQLLRISAFARRAARCPPRTTPADTGGCCLSTDSDRCRPLHPNRWSPCAAICGLFDRRNPPLDNLRDTRCRTARPDTCDPDPARRGPATRCVRRPFQWRPPGLAPDP